MKESNGNVLSLYSFIVSIISLVTNIVIIIQGYTPSIVLVFYTAFVLAIVSSIISIVGIIIANKKWKIYAILALIIGLICILYGIYSILYASYPI